MSQGDTVVQINRVLQPLTLFAAIDVRVGGSTPAEGVLVYNFDDTVVEYLDFDCLLLNYAGGGLTWTIPWLAKTAIVDDVRWGIALRRFEADEEDLDAAHTYVYTDAADSPAPSASGEYAYPTVALANGAPMDLLENGEKFIARIRRTAATANMAGDAQLLMPFGQET